MAASLLALPYDILEIILHNIDSRKDLLSFALVCTFCRDITIPRHLEYREIHLTLQPEDHVIWTQLAERADLAANVHKLAVLNRLSTRHLPTTLVPSSQLPDAADPSLSNVRPAVRNMKHLNSLALHINYRGLKPGDVLSDVMVMASPSLDHLAVHGVMGEDLTQDQTEDETHPIWSVSDLQSLVLPRTVHKLPVFCLRSVLSLSPSLKVLRLPDCVGSSQELASSFAECRFSLLMELELCWAWTDATRHFAVDFLRAHPMIETLAWGDHAQSIFSLENALPALKHLTAGSWNLVEAVFQGNEVGLASLTCWGMFTDRSLLQTIATRRVYKLAISCTDLGTLQALSSAFPYVTHLYIREGLVVKRTVAQMLRRALSGPVVASADAVDRAPPTLEDALELFPELDVIGGMSFDSAGEMEKVLARFPQLRRFEGPVYSGIPRVV
ncbi:hypothetical protein BV25DRAFT_1913210 [Artomyces pyxidatus]|uniref:Uncharacterized protein n=1 Tax=Artomyces pyxidatus TaxID=48021 RepID=A0ACB8TA27_9AGAM|nr:hypothetical protein BV25DRAFT_1913210 [Artomyces pyxidatus]